MRKTGCDVEAAVVERGTPPIKFKLQLRNQDFSSLLFLMGIFRDAQSLRIRAFAETSDIQFFDLRDLILRQLGKLILFIDLGED